jgi:hypothetical protein
MSPFKAMVIPKTLPEHAVRTCTTSFAGETVFDTEEASMETKKKGIVSHRSLG